MKQKMQWLLLFWRRQWKYQNKTLKRQIYIEVGTVVLVCILFILFSKRLNQVAHSIWKLPEAVSAFWGIDRDTQVGGSIFFYIRWLMMPLNVIWVLVYCNRMIRSLWREEETGNIYYLCNQWYSRTQIILAQYTFVVIEFICNYTFFYVLLIILSGSRTLSIWWGQVKMLSGLYAKSAIVILMFISISMCYAVISEKKIICSFAWWIIFGSLALGNLYKIRDFLVLLLQRTNRNYAGFLAATRWLGVINALSPLSWINPFTRYGGLIVLLQILICVLVSAVTVFISVMCYQARRL